MASFLDAILGAISPQYTARRMMPQAGSMETPPPNPLRMPRPTGSLLGELLQLPAVTPAEMQQRKAQDSGEGGASYGLSLPAISPGDMQERKKSRDREDAARASYQQSAAKQKEQDKLPAIESPEKPDTEDTDASAQPDDAATVAAPRGPDGQVRVPVGPMAPVADPFRAAMLQAGLALMTPQWGNGLSQLGQAIGQGASAAGRAQELNVREEQRAEAQADKGLKREATEAEIEKTKAETGLINRTESSRSKRLGSKTPTVLDEAAAAAGLGPKGKAFLQQRLKTLNQEDILGEDEDAVTKFNAIINEAKQLDTPAAPTSAVPPKAPNVGGTEQATNLPLVKTPEEASKLPPGTEFLFERNGKLERGTVPK